MPRKTQKGRENARARQRRAQLRQPTPRASRTRPARHAQTAHAVPGAVKAAVAAAAAIAVVLTTMQVASCVRDATTYTFPYSWENLSLEDGRYRYSVDGETLSRVGVDVSSHQGEIDWEAVAGDGVEFAFIRCGWRGATEGQLYEDDCFTYNLNAAHAAGIDVGVYFFSQAISEEEAREEARFALELLDGASLDCPVAFDMEPLPSVGGRADDLDQATRVACAKAFCEVIEAAGYATMVYGNDADLLSLYGAEYLAGVSVWVAEYGATPTTGYDFSIWQYTDSGQVVGIGTACDIDLDLSAALAKTREG